ncbi:MAG: hypothetical protein ACM3TT_00420 [Syntrophothermus sp.]
MKRELCREPSNFGRPITSRSEPFHIGWVTAVSKTRQPGRKSGTAVYQFFPSAPYGLRVTRIAFSLLRPGGTALIHVRYGNTSSKPEEYAENPAFFTTYGIDEFWSGAEECGFEALAVALSHQSNSAYYFLRKPDLSS